MAQKIIYRTKKAKDQKKKKSFSLPIGDRSISVCFWILEIEN
jgi:hypothetical protein